MNAFSYIAKINLCYPFQHNEPGRQIILDKHKIKEKSLIITINKINDINEKNINFINIVKGKEYSKNDLTNYNYLWILDYSCLKLILEKQDQKEYKHTNITGGDLAVYGGEIIFIKLENKEKGIIIKNKSGRYDHRFAECWNQIILFYKNFVGKKYTIFDFGRDILGDANAIPIKDVPLSLDLILSKKI